jgi:hypothetical protein
MDYVHSYEMPRRRFRSNRMPAARLATDKSQGFSGRALRALQLRDSKPTGNRTCELRAAPAKGLLGRGDGVGNRFDAPLPPPSKADMFGISIDVR